MKDRIQFEKNATVLDLNGGQVGLLDRVVVNPSNNVLTDIVVRTGGLLKQEEKVVPVGLVEDANYGHVLLTREAGELDDFPPFEVERIIEDGKSQGESSTLEDEVRPAVTGNPFMGMPVTLPSSRRIKTRIEQNIPEGTVALKEGAKVYSVDGKHVGNVERVLADPAGDTITHLVVSRGIFIRELKLVPIWWVSSLGEEKVNLRVNRNSVEGLADLPIAE